MWTNLSTWIGLTYIGTGKEIADMMTKSRIALALRSERVQGVRGQSGVFNLALRQRNTQVRL